MDIHAVKKQLANISLNLLGSQPLFWLILSLLLVLTLTPSPPKPISLSHIDKLYHFIGFAVLALFFCSSFKQRQSFKLLSSLFLLGIMIECLQYYIPNREFSLLDIIANCLGAIAGYYLALLIQIKLGTEIK